MKSCFKNMIFFKHDITIATSIFELALDAFWKRDLWSFSFRGSLPYLGNAGQQAR